LHDAQPSIEPAAASALAAPPEHACAD